MIRHYEGLTIDDFTEGLGQPAMKRMHSPNSISYKIPGTENYLEFEFKKHYIIKIKRT